VHGAVLLPACPSRRGINRSKGLAIDWAQLSAEWSELYRATLDEIIEGKSPWTRVDHIYREALDTLLDGRGLSRRERDELNAVWSRLDARPERSKD
jgi:2-haloacid dehalogenase